MKSKVSVINVAYVKGKNYDEAMTSRTYTYYTALDVKPGDVLFVPTGKANAMKRVIVESVDEYKEFPYPIKEVGLDELIYTVSELSRNVVEASREVKEEETRQLFGQSVPVGVVQV